MTGISTTRHGDEVMEPERVMVLLCQRFVVCGMYTEAERPDHLGIRRRLSWQRIQGIASRLGLSGIHAGRSADGFGGARQHPMTSVAGWHRTALRNYRREGRSTAGLRVAIFRAC